MSNLLAQDRAEDIWGEGAVPQSVHRWRGFNGEQNESWVVRLPNGSYHGFDGNGHTTCHPECAKLEVECCK